MPGEKTNEMLSAEVDTLREQVKNLADKLDGALAANEKQSAEMAQNMREYDEKLRASDLRLQTVERSVADYGVRLDEKPAFVGDDEAGFAHLMEWLRRIAQKYYSGDMPDIQRYMNDPHKRVPIPGTVAADPVIERGIAVQGADGAWRYPDGTLREEGISTRV